MEVITDKLAGWLQHFGMSEDMTTLLLRIGAIIAILVVAFVIDRICRKLIIPVVRRITARTEFRWDDYLLGNDVLNDLCRLLAPVVVYVLLPAILPEDAFMSFMMKVCRIYIIIVCMKLICTMISSLYAMSSEHEKLKDHSLKGFYQMLKLVVICVGSIIIISMLIDRNPGAILTGLGAGTAVLMLVFQDTIKGFVAGIQLIANDMLRPGD